MATDTPGKRANDVDVESAVTGATYAQQTEGGKLRLVVIRGLPQRFDLEGCRKAGSAALCEAQAAEYEAMRRKYISERSGQAPGATDLRAGLEELPGSSA